MTHPAGESDTPHPGPNPGNRTEPAARIAAACREAFRSAYWSGSMAEFLALLQADPAKFSRTAFQLVNDMIAHYGSTRREDAGESVVHYGLFDDPFDGGLRRIFGLERTLMRLAKYIRSAAKEEGRERIFVFHGPVGTAKTSTVDLVARGLEDYTRTPAGETMRFRWIFGKRFVDDAQGVGFGATEMDDELGEIVASIPCQLNENPLNLIPRPQRRELLTQLFEERYPDPRTRPVIPRKTLEGELCYNCRQIWDFLMARYDGDWNRVMRHVRVERMVFSESAGRGIAKVFPEGNVETDAQVIALDENYRFISNLIASLNLVRFRGKYVAANRGLIHYSDIFKKPVQYLQHLLSAVEEHRIDFGDVNADVDVMIIGTTNPFEYRAVRENPLSRALRSRARKIDVPYLLTYADEQQIYDVSLKQARRSKPIAPHTTEYAALFAVLTRLEKSRLTDLLPDSLMRKVNRPIAKALIYNNETPDDLTEKEKEALTREAKRALRNEHPVPDELEGMHGIPTRILQNIFADLCEEGDGECITPFHVFSLLDKVIAQGKVNYDFLGDAPDEGFHDPAEFVRILRNRYGAHVTREVEQSLVAVADSELEGRIREYLRHVTAYNRSEKVENAQTGATEPPNETLMTRIEKLVGVDPDNDEEKKFWRFKMIARATAQADATGPIDIRKTYDDIYKSLRAMLYDEKKTRIAWGDLNAALEKLRDMDTLDEDLADYSSSTRNSVRTMLQNMADDYGYCFSCARRTALYVVSARA
jgi:serine protein kinase